MPADNDRCEIDSEKGQSDTCQLQGLRAGAGQRFMVEPAGRGFASPLSPDGRNRHKVREMGDRRRRDNAVPLTADPHLPLPASGPVPLGGTLSAPDYVTFSERRPVRL